MADKTTGARKSGQKKKPKEGPASPNVIKAMAQGALTNGRYSCHPHCRGHMDERNYDANDLKHIIDTGDYQRYPPDWRSDHGNYLYFAVGKDLQGKRLLVVFSVKDKGKWLIFVSGERHLKGKPV